MPELPETQSGSPVEFTKLIRTTVKHHDWMNQLKMHYANVYGEDVPLTWILYKLIEEKLADPMNREPRYPVLDSLAQHRPQGRPVGHVFSDIETFMMMTTDKKITED